MYSVTMATNVHTTITASIPAVFTTTIIATLGNDIAIWIWDKANRDLFLGLVHRET